MLQQTPHSQNTVQPLQAQMKEKKMVTKMGMEKEKGMMMH